MQYINDWCLLRQHTIIKNGQEVFGGHADDFLLSAYKHLGTAYPKFYKMDHLSKLAFLAAEVLLQGNNLDRMAKPEAIGVVLANRHSSLDTDARYFKTMQAFPSPALFVYTLANVMVGELCIRHQIKGENTVFIFGKYEIQFLSAYINALMETGAAKAVIGGWVDVMDGHYEAFLYLASHLKTDSSIIHNHKNIQTLYGKPNPGSEIPDH
jgi:hypothetical protein